MELSEILILRHARSELPAAATNNWTFLWIIIELQMQRAFHVYGMNFFFFFLMIDLCRLPMLLFLSDVNRVVRAEAYGKESQPSETGK